MNAADVVGYAHEGFFYCNTCEYEHDGKQRKKAGEKIFAQQEGWEEMTCDGCGETLGDVEGVET